MYDRVEKYTIDRLDAVYTFDPIKPTLRRDSPYSMHWTTSEDTSTEQRRTNVDDLDPELITLIPFGTVIDEIRACTV